MPIRPSVTDNTMRFDLLTRHILAFLASVALLGCQRVETRATESRVGDVGVADTAFHPAWSRTAVIYEVNVRQYTPEGTFSALQRHLPRLRNLGVDILWLMPVQPIGKLNRKGGLGSYYSIANYTDRKSTRLNSSHGYISYAVFCLKKKK